MPADIKFRGAKQDRSADLSDRQTPDHKILAEARMQRGEKFNLRGFHDFVWKNGNVPIALHAGNISAILNYKTEQLVGIWAKFVRFPFGTGNKISALSDAKS
jgi:hypothetical protein